MAEVRSWFLQRPGEVDELIVARQGMSLTDLWKQFENFAVFPDKHRISTTQNDHAFIIPSVDNGNVPVMTALWDLLPANTCFEADAKADLNSPSKKVWTPKRKQVGAVQSRGRKSPKKGDPPAAETQILDQELKTKLGEMYKKAKAEEDKTARAELFEAILEELKKYPGKRVKFEQFWNNLKVWFGTEADYHIIPGLIRCPICDHDIILSKIDNLANFRQHLESIACMRAGNGANKTLLARLEFKSPRDHAEELAANAFKPIVDPPEEEDQAGGY